MGTAVSEVDNTHAATVSADAQAEAHARGEKIGVLIVAYNALTTLVPVLKRIPQAVLDNLTEIAVFDDRSPDDTYLVAHGYKTLHRADKLTIHRNPANLGYGGNQKTGFRYFIEKGFDVVILLHGDGQYAPEHLAHLYEPIVRGDADAVFGSRMMRDHGGPLKGGMPLYKYTGNRMLSAFENYMLGMRLTEFHCGYRAYSVAALRNICLDNLTNDFHFDTEIIVKLNHQRRRIIEVPIPTYYGDEICHVNGLRYAKNVVRAVTRYHRTVTGARRYPEFAEYAPAYPRKTTKHSSHEYLLREVGEHARVLDLGCGDGLLAAELTKAGNTVVGVDLAIQPGLPEAFECYFAADLDRGLEPVMPELVRRGPFDVILVGDLLEHLRDPARVLRDCRRLLVPNGRVLISVPNIANLVVRLSLLFGRFNYADKGILDRTHLRFYTLKTARELACDCGYVVDRVSTTTIPVEFVLSLSPNHWLCRALHSVAYGLTRLRRTLFGYQFVLSLHADDVRTY
jgi:2-polyprenyl-3-methyl-5-hydroxy-6-metoxy-1,4-benzoquinol methylase